MGRAWPPRPADLQEAEEICRELDLGQLLDRMPGRMLQMVGDTGWQLSHGEKSRLYLGVKKFFRLLLPVSNLLAF